jgi:predicted ribonuclease YlaK
MEYSIHHNSASEGNAINIISDPQDQLLCKFISQDEEFVLLPKDIEKDFRAKVLRLNSEKVKSAFQFIGCKTKLAAILCDVIFAHFSIQTQCKSPNSQIPEKNMSYTTREKFLTILRKHLAEHSLTKEHNIFDFELAIDLVEQKRSMIVLLGGTSGTGKSTASSLLASRFGISTVLSTDSIRHIMRNFMTTEEAPILFASTYEAGSKLPIDEEMTEKKKTVTGFQQQATMIQQRLEPVELKSF